MRASKRMLFHSVGARSSHSLNHLVGAGQSSPSKMAFIAHGAVPSFLSAHPRRRTCPRGLSEFSNPRRSGARGRFETVLGDEEEFITLRQTQDNPRRAIGGVF